MFNQAGRKTQNPGQALHLSTADHPLVGYQPWLNIGSARWLRFGSARTTVVLNGGCLANRLLDDALTQHLHDAGLQVWRASHYPCGDGGLSLGQAWVAHHRLTTPVSLTA